MFLNARGPGALNSCKITAASRPICGNLPVVGSKYRIQKDETIDNNVTLFYASFKRIVRGLPLRLLHFRDQ